jgi:molybdopterin synthase sulfur carrier subunit
MPLVWIPTQMRELTGGKARVAVSGTSLREVLEGLEVAYPGIRERLCEGDEISPHLAVVVDGELSRLRMHQPLTEQSEVHFVPAMHGGV